MQHSNAYTYRFAATVTIVCSVLLASAATLLKPFQTQNELLDVRKNILASVGIKPEEGKTFSHKQVEKLYKENIKEFVIDDKGEIVDGISPGEIDPKKDKNRFPLYEKQKDGQVESIAYSLTARSDTLYFRDIRLDTGSEYC